MKLSDLLQDEWITVPVEARDLRGALTTLAGALAETAEDDVGQGTAELLESLADGRGSELVRVTDAIVLAAASTELVRGLSVMVGLADRPFRVQAHGDSGTARVVILVLSPPSRETVRGHVVPMLTRILRESQRTRELLTTRMPVSAAAFTEALNSELHGRLLVQDALTPVRFRVYADTPLSAVVDLMVRRRLEKIPVVGDAHELLGLITAGDVLQELLPRWRSGKGRPTTAGDGPAAREFMQRSVMCVSEEQSLLDAANLMVSRDVDRLPVVREGVLIGFLERDTVLKALYMP